MDGQLITRDEVIQKLKANLEASINRMKQTTDQKRRDVTFEIGEIVSQVASLLVIISF